MLDLMHLNTEMVYLMDLFLCYFYHLSASSHHLFAESNAWACLSASVVCSMLCHFCIHFWSGSLSHNCHIFSCILGTVFMDGNFHNIHSSYCLVVLCNFCCCIVFVFLIIAFQILSYLLGFHA